MYWIDELDTYKNGYNATRGGDGKILIDDDEVIENYRLYGRASLVAKLMHRDEGQISKILKEHNIYPENHPYDSGVIKQKKKVSQYNKEGVLINTFDSVSNAAKFLYENGYVKNIKSGVRTHICDVANGKNKVAYGFIWKYIN